MAELAAAEKLETLLSSGANESAIAAAIEAAVEAAIAPATPSNNMVSDEAGAGAQAASLASGERAIQVEVQDSQGGQYIHIEVVQTPSHSSSTVASESGTVQRNINTHDAEKNPTKH